MTEMVVVDGLRKVFGARGRRGSADTLAVADVSFSIPAGGSLAVVGESGSGKTTLARMLLALEPPTAGTIHIAGEDCTAPPRKLAARRRRARQIQAVFQDPYRSLDPSQTAESCLNEVLKLHFRDWTADARAERVRELMDLVGLDDRQSRALPHALSGGQRQRVAIARALASEPSVLVLDEAVAALDVSIKAQVLNLLADIRESTGVTYLFISHDLAVIRQVTDDTIVMRHGSIVEQGRTGAVLDDPQHPYTQLLRSSVPRRGWKPTRRLAMAEGGGTK
jgi:ABC-type glutathione transport system ATPase component